jgi:hypothetical protein
VAPKATSPRDRGIADARIEQGREMAPERGDMPLRNNAKQTPRRE